MYEHCFTTTRIANLDSYIENLAVYTFVLFLFFVFAITGEEVVVENLLRMFTYLIISNKNKRKKKLKLELELQQHIFTFWCSLLLLFFCSSINFLLLLLISLWYCTNLFGWQIFTNKITSKKKKVNKRKKKEIAENIDFIY